MDDRGEPQRVEIELTERAPGRAGRRRRDRAATSTADEDRRPSSSSPDRDSGLDREIDLEHAAVVTSNPEQIGSGPLATERGRLIAATLTAGVVALFIGWALGRSGDDGEAARTVDATTRGSTATTVPETVLPGETIPEAETPRPTPAPTTSRPPRTTTTTIPPVWEESTITIDPRLAGTTDRLVAVTAERDLIELDLATGTLRTLDVPGWPIRQTPYAPIAGDDFVAVQFDNGDPPEVFVADATAPIRMQGSDAWSIFWDLPARTAWTLSFEGSTGRPSQMMIERTAEGAPTGRSLDLNGMWPAGLSDPAGGLLIGDGSGGVFNVSPDGSRRVSDGRLLALRVGHVLTYTCGETLDDCGVRLADRATGASQLVPLSDDVPLQSLLNAWWQIPLTSAQLTLNGSAAVLPLFDETGGGRLALAVVDTATGEVTIFDGLGPYPSGVWSSDDRRLFVVVDGVATAYDRTTGEQFPISAELPDAASLTIRLTG